MPQEWKGTTIIVLYKNVDQTGCSNYQVISFMAYAGKIILKTISHRLSEYCEKEEVLPDKQCGLRQGRPTVDMVFFVRRLH